MWAVSGRVSLRPVTAQPGMRGGMPLGWERWMYARPRGRQLFSCSGSPGLLADLSAVRVGSLGPLVAWALLRQPVAQWSLSPGILA